MRAWLLIGSISLLSLVGCAQLQQLPGDFYHASMALKQSAESRYQQSVNAFAAGLLTPEQFQAAQQLYIGYYQAWHGPDWCALNPTAPDQFEAEIIKAPMER
ncbi:MAG TPA: hypothetical protein VNP04_21520 [Alphaproteobacteria bacterium]|nr:hypothetical protein [Alphaproteobacteria bacterium]